MNTVWNGSALQNSLARIAYLYTMRNVNEVGGAGTIVGYVMK